MASSTEMTYYSIHDEYGNGRKLYSYTEERRRGAGGHGMSGKRQDSSGRLNLYGEGSCWEFTETVRETGLVDIRR